MNPRKKFKAVVIGTSAGGFHALQVILGALPNDFEFPIIIVQHRMASSNALPELLNHTTQLRVKEAEDKEPLVAGTVYVAPADYHLLVEKDGRLQLSEDERENFSRPSIDVLFESAADAFGDKLIGVLLTGASRDGAKGLGKIKAYQGCTIVQDPRTAEFKVMPQSAIAELRVDHILPLEEISNFLKEGLAHA